MRSRDPPRTRLLGALKTRFWEPISKWAAAAKGFFAATRGSGALALEGSMITLKGLMTIGARHRLRLHAEYVDREIS
jgi:hypothetical protein